jgi:hypothetical protein
METSAIVKRKHEAKYGDYRTKLQTLNIYGRMQEAIATGQPYQTILDATPEFREQLIGGLPGLLLASQCTVGENPDY